MSTAIAKQSVFSGGFAPVLTEDYRVGCWRVCPPLNQLQHNKLSVTRHLEPRLMHLLSLLAANSGRVLDRDTLVQALWPRVIVNENSLTRAVSELRKQLTDPAGEQSHFIDTIPKRGYRLLLTADTRALSRQAVAAKIIRLDPHRAWPIAAGCAMLGLGLMLAYSTVFPMQAEFTGSAQLLADEIIQGDPTYIGADITLSTGPANIVSATTMEAPVIADDLRRFAYIQYDHSGSTIYLGELDMASAPTPVYNSTEKLSNLTWSPLGNALLFARKPSMTTAALYAQTPASELLSLELDSLTLRKLVEEDPAAAKDNRPALNLT